MIRLEDIHKSYRLGPVTTHVLDGVSMRIEPGDRLAITGPSGCGKSTLMNIVGLMDRPSRGRYWLDGDDVSALGDDASARVRNARIGFVFQSFHLLARKSAVENVRLPLVYRGVSRAAGRTRAAEALALVGMADRAGHRPGELSGGQQQRVAIARALVGEPGLIVADEPTAALDPGTGVEIMDLLERLSTERGIAFVIVTHNPEVAARCPRHARIEGGRIVEVRGAKT